MITPNEMAQIYFRALRGRAIIDLESQQAGRAKGKEYWAEVIKILRRLH